MFLYSQKFSTGKTQKVVFHLLSNRIFQILFVHGKQPTFSKGFDKKIITWKPKTKRENLFLSPSLAFLDGKVVLNFRANPNHGKLVTLCHPAKANIQL